MASKVEVCRNPIRCIILLIFFISVSLLKAYAQDDKQDNYQDRFPFDQKTENGTPSFKERLFFGGNFGLQFGGVTDIQLSPVVGYWVMPRIAVALGPSYRYFKNYVSETSIYGGKTYVELMIIQDLNTFLPLGVHTGIFAHLEDELLSLKANYWKYPLNPRGRFYQNTVLAGGGISQQIGRRSSMNFMVLWPLNESLYEIYSKPEVRITFIF